MSGRSSQISNSELASTTDTVRAEMGQPLAHLGRTLFIICYKFLNEAISNDQINALVEQRLRAVWKAIGDGQLVAMKERSEMKTKIEALEDQVNVLKNGLENQVLNNAHLEQEIEKMREENEDLREQLRSTPAAKSATVGHLSDPFRILQKEIKEDKRRVNTLFQIPESLHREFSRVREATRKEPKSDFPAPSEADRLRGLGRVLISSFLGEKILKTETDFYFGDDSGNTRWSVNAREEDFYTVASIFAAVDRGLKKINLKVRVLIRSLFNELSLLARKMLTSSTNSGASKAPELLVLSRLGIYGSAIQVFGEEE